LTSKSIRDWEEHFSSLADIMDKLEETQIKRKLLL
jgi:hypothetical protein